MLKSGGIWKIAKIRALRNLVKTWLTNQRQKWVISRHFVAVSSNTVAFRGCFEDRIRARENEKWKLADLVKIIGIWSI